jgi:hypothetical protein
VLLAEISLHGPLLEIPEPLFLMREHPQRRVRHHYSQRPYTPPGPTDAEPAGAPLLPEWALLAELAAAVQRSASDRRTRWRCYREVWRWLITRRARLGRDLVLAATRVPALGGAIGRLHGKIVRATWNARVHRFANDVASLVPSGAVLILANQAQFATDGVVDRKILPFLERGGQYWGVPPDDQTAIRELERMRRAGASFLVFAWPAFWWLEFFADFTAHLRSRFRCVAQNARLIAFDLRHEIPAVGGGGA